jgi:hypothetical protein
MAGAQARAPSRTPRTPPHSRQYSISKRPMGSVWHVQGLTIAARLCTPFAAG